MSTEQDPGYRWSLDTIGYITPEGVVRIAAVLKPGDVVELVFGNPANSCEFDKRPAEVRSMHGDCFMGELVTRDTLGSGLPIGQPVTLNTMNIISLGVSVRLRRVHQVSLKIA